MLPKPPACLECSWYGDGQGFVPDSIPVNAEIVFAGQNPGKDEELLGEPFVGKSGQLLRGFEKQYLAGLPAGHANIVKCRHQDAAGRRTDWMPRPGTKEWQSVVGYCTQAHLRLPGDALIVPLGEHAKAYFWPEVTKVPMLHVRGSYVET